MDEQPPVSYEAVTPGTPVFASDGSTRIGTVEHVLKVEELDLFEGIAIATDAGLRFVDADKIDVMTLSYVRCTLDSAQAAALPAPDGPPVYRVDALADTGSSLHDRVGRLFRRPHWTREDD